MRVFFVLATSAALLIYSTRLWAPYHLDDQNVTKIAEDAAGLEHAAARIRVVLVQPAVPPSHWFSASMARAFLLPDRLGCLDRSVVSFVLPKNRQGFGK